MDRSPQSEAEIEIAPFSLSPDSSPEFQLKEKIKAQQLKR